jgi:hypothetical protein
VDISPARYGTITESHISFTLPQSWLDEHHFTPQDITVYHNVGDGWEALPTTMDRVETGQVYFTATCCGFSLFAITGQPTEIVIVQENGGQPGTFGEPAGVSPPVSRPAAQKPVVTQTAAIPASPPTPASPLPAIVIIAAAGGVLIGGVFVIRRWWIKRLNPALFEDTSFFR